MGPVQLIRSTASSPPDSSSAENRRMDFQSSQRALLDWQLGSAGEKLLHHALLDVSRFASPAMQHGNLIVCISKNSRDRILFLAIPWKADLKGVRIVAVQSWHTGATCELLKAEMG